jgi:hypothetical protein
MSNLQTEEQADRDYRATRIGGLKGHEEEVINGNLSRLYHALRWKPIPDCTGRYTCRDHSIASLSPLSLLEEAGVKTPNSIMAFQEYEFHIPDRPDALLVVPLDEANSTGLITYAKVSDNAATTKFVHTLNAPSGFRRKLEAVGVQVTEDGMELSDQKFRTTS